MTRFPFCTFLLFVSFFSTTVSAQAPLHQSAGKVTRIVNNMNGLKIELENGLFEVWTYSPSIVRIRFSKDGKFDDLSYALVAKPATVAYSFNESQELASLTTDSLILEIKKNPCRFVLKNKKGQVVNEDEPAFGTGWIGEQITTYKKLQQDEKFVGLGEKTGPLNRRGEGYINWNTDFFAYPSGADPIYQTLPFYIGIHNGLNYGLFMDNCYRSHFNFGASNDRFASFMVEGGDMDYYLIYHNKVADIIKSYSYLTGFMSMPPLWGLGLQQCRYSYYPDTEVKTLAKTFRDKKIPADAIVLDIHYMDKYKIFTWDKERFANPKGMTDELKKMGFNTVVIIDPGIKVEPGYKAYEEGVKDNLFLKYPDNSNYSGQVWPGWCHFPDFTNPKTRDWWGQSFKAAYIDNGVEGFWNDMNEPATWGQRFPDLVEFNFEGKKGSHRKGHNVYGLKMVESTFEGTKKHLGGRRPFILTRAGYSGIQRYSAVWTGDNVSSDDHMLAGIRLLNSMGLTGVPYTGMDVGGFTGGPSKELFGRWVTIGAFTPFFRIHSAINTKESDPWSYGEEVEAICKNYISLRYKLLPYLYSAFYEAHTTGMPISRSLAINYPHDNKIYDGRFQNQFFCGPGILVCPVESTKQITKVYLPDADGWYDFMDDTYYQGGTEIFADCPIERLPVYVKGGSIIPMQSLVQHTGQKPTDTLFVHLYNGKKGSEYVYYEDDGETYKFENGDFFKRTLRFDPAKKSLVAEKAEGKLNSKFRHIKFYFHGMNNIKQVTIDGRKVNVADERISFVDPLPHFDPVGSGKPAPVAAVKSITVSNDSGRLALTW